MSDKISILVLTYNRYRFLERMLRFYQASGASAPAHILDSSAPSEETQEIQNLISKPFIHYHHFHSDLKPMEKLAMGLKHVTTPYTVIWADDDFLNPAAFDEGVRYMESHPEVSLVHGVCGTFREGPNGIESVGPYGIQELKAATAAQRFLQHLTRYTVTFYAIHRTDQLRNNVSHCNANGFGYYWGEMALGSLSAIQGKFHKMNRLYLMKQAHDGMDSWKPGQKSMDIFDWVVSDVFFSKAPLFRRVLAAELSKVDKMNLEEAEEIIKQGLWGYLVKGLQHKWHQTYMVPNSIVASLKSSLRGISWLRRIWEVRHSILVPKMNPMSLKNLMNPSNPLHREFLPIAQVVRETSHRQLKVTA